MINHTIKMESGVWSLDFVPTYLVLMMNPFLMKFSHKSKSHEAFYHVCTLYQNPYYPGPPVLCKLKMPY